MIRRRKRKGRRKRIDEDNSEGWEYGWKAGTKEEKRDDEVWSAQSEGQAQSYHTPNVLTILLICRF